MVLYLLLTKITTIRLLFSLLGPNNYISVMHEVQAEEVGSPGLCPSKILVT